MNNENEPRSRKSKRNRDQEKVRPRMSKSVTPNYANASVGLYWHSP